MIKITNIDDDETKELASSGLTKDSNGIIRDSKGVIVDKTHPSFKKVSTI